jgi:DNA-binding CsgD family transcriptional regulator
MGGVREGAMIERDARARRSLTERVERFAETNGLSRRERSVLFLILAGVHPKAIGGALDCRYSTVRTHLRRMGRKLACAGTLQLVARFLSESLEADP